MSSTPARYNFRETEAKWQKAWDERQTFRARMDRARPKYYVLEMFPYPSGRIHMGHVRNYTQGDVIARYKRARGFNVLHPMGWDAFGLPAENAAMEKKVHPKKWVYENIATMKAQLKVMGLSLDWSRELASCDPSYYRHQQKMFLDFWKAGLAYRKEAWVNWDPVDNTVLANEQVIEGKGWRTGAPVERRMLTQWNLRITKFADELLSRLDTLERWPEKVRLMQANWIGKSRGARVFWQLTDAVGRRSRQARDLHHAARHALWRFLRGAVARTSAGHRAGREGSGPAALRRRKPQDRHRRGRGRDRGEDRLQAAAARQASVDAGQDPAGLCRQLRADGIRHRRHLRLPRPRRARPRIRHQVRPADHPGGDARGRRPQELQRRRRSRSSRMA